MGMSLSVRILNFAWNLTDWRPYDRAGPKLTSGQAGASHAFIQQNGAVFNVRVTAPCCPGAAPVGFLRKMNE
jgi:hypothetical protein